MITIIINNTNASHLLNVSCPSGLEDQLKGEETWEEKGNEAMRVQKAGGAWGPLPSRPACFICKQLKLSNLYHVIASLWLCIPVSRRGCPSSCSNGSFPRVSLLVALLSRERQGSGLPSRSALPVLSCQSSIACRQTRVGTP